MQRMSCTGTLLRRHCQVRKVTSTAIGCDEEEHPQAGLSELRHYSAAAKGACSQEALEDIRIQALTSLYKYGARLWRAGIGKSAQRAT